MQFTVDQAQYIYLLHKLKDNGMVITPDYGGDEVSISGHGVRADVTFDPKVNEAEVIITHKPFIIGEAHIENGIQEVIDGMPKDADLTGKVVKEQTN